MRGRDRLPGETGWRETAD